MRRVLLQRGKGISGFLRFFRHTLPMLFKAGSKTIVPIAKTALKSKTGQKLKKALVSSAVNTGADLLSGKNPKRRGSELKRDLKKITKAAFLNKINGQKRKKTSDNQTKKSKANTVKKRKTIFDPR